MDFCSDSRLQIRSLSHTYHKSIAFTFLFYSNNPALLNVANLRGTAGADFESKAAVLRGKPVKSIMQRLLPLCYEERDYIAYGEVERFVLIKGGSCFIFVDEAHPSALYVIELEELVPVLENPRKPDKNSFTISPRTIDHNLVRRENVSPDTMQTVLLKYRDGKHAYQFTFDIGASGDKSTVKRFMDAITQATSKEVAAYTASAVRTKDGGKGDAKA